MDGGLAQCRNRDTANGGASPNPSQPAVLAIGPSASTSAGPRAARVDPNDYDTKTVAKLIAARRLAPFYEGQFDERGGSTSHRTGHHSSRASVLTSGSVRRNAGESWSSPSVSLGKLKKTTKRGAADVVDQKWLSTGLAECPICLLWYPKNVNFTKCCKKPICTLCFVSMRRPVKVDKLICCPFCRSVNFAVVYRTPEAILSKAPLPKKAVVCELIRPPRMLVRQVPRPTYYRYGPAGGPQASPTFARPSAARQPNGRFQFYPVPATSSRSPMYPARVMQPAPRHPPIGQPRPSVQPQQRQLSAQEVASYEQQALNRAIRLSMLEY